ncbi:MAG: orotidine-5'-phosphate decarboxylase [Candidatus Ryanbacteria bacterium CG10_big_fil_rev_8_21_14_0_10_43_42]|uniref:Orotidine 5'-phosphate decarboxylase n=1 Tax=Candidatus Ryanbacteria bacterium CG10_big_fil_rev_8_21_14_0_10_43_42 TaxID=1974864 RepID=A0A2M8KWC1_9BACT|nr:MAG: orotidine-5'-phosphate decarboxylase [Candidatus Ryanbacteria bacterium CG10_big_fil_rev_8_21_14_0_10_43_42]
MDIEERLIIAADYDPEKSGGVKDVVRNVLNLADNLEGLGVYIKVNSALRVAGYYLINKLHDRGLKVFADLKLIDIPNTMKTDALLLADYFPEILTVMCCAGTSGMRAVQNVLSKTKVLGVTVLTSLNDEECRSVFNCSVNDGVLRFAHMAKLAGLNELVISPKEVEVIKNNFDSEFWLNTPGIRPEWNLVEGDDQSRFLTPVQAIRNGATRIVVGRPITKDKNPREATERTLEEIRQGLSEN